MSQPAQTWNEYWGLLADGDGCRLFGFSGSNPEASLAGFRSSIGGDGGCFGFVSHGSARVGDTVTEFNLKSSQWFCSFGPVEIVLDAVDSGGVPTDSRVVIIQKSDFRGLYSMGGPIEKQGRLKYIDGCTDTLLCAPPLLGDPCLNLLHFPPGTRQTPHLHPSVRLGVVANGRGIFHIEGEKHRLTEGTIFRIQTGARHSFETEGDSMTVIAFHPDSDWGPQHENHPMINRTWFGEEKGKA